MSDDIKELVKRLRAFRPTYGWPEEQATVVKQTLGDEAADALEALVAERDRLKAALEAKQADPASAVCEWTDHGTEWISQCKHRFGAFASTKGRFFCPGCGKPIKFTEAKQ